MESSHLSLHFGIGGVSFLGSVDIKFGILVTHKQLEKYYGGTDLP